MYEGIIRQEFKQRIRHARAVKYRISPSMAMAPIEGGSLGRPMAGSSAGGAGGAGPAAKRDSQLVQRQSSSGRGQQPQPRHTNDEQPDQTDKHKGRVASLRQRATHAEPISPAATLAPGMSILGSPAAFALPGIRNRDLE